MNKIDVPESIVDICREFAAIARKHELKDFSASFNPPFNHEWGGKVSFSWEDGRHGEGSNNLCIVSEYRIHTKVNPVKPVLVDSSELIRQV